MQTDPRVSVTYGVSCNSTHNTLKNHNKITQCSKKTPQAKLNVIREACNVKEVKNVNETKMKRRQTKHHGGIIHMIRTTGQVTDRMLLKG